MDSPKGLKLADNSIAITNNRVSIFHRHIVETSDNLANRLFDEAERLAYDHIDRENYNKDKILENVKNANRLLLRVFELNPVYQEALNLYAQNLRLTLKDYKRAIEAYTKLIEINPQFEGAIIRRGLCKQAMGDHIGHLEDFNNSILVKGGKMESSDYVSRSIIKQKLLDFKGVKEDLLRAIELGNNHAFTYEKLGNMYLELKDYKKCFEAFDKAMEIELTNPNPINNRNAPFPLLYRIYHKYIKALLEIGNHRKSLNLLEQMKIYFPDKPRTKELQNLLSNYLQ